MAYSAGNLFAGSPKGDSVWLFGLDGTLEPAAPAGAAMTFTREAEGTADPDAGKTVYDTACTFCHGEQGEGGHGGGKSLVDARRADAVILKSSARAATRCRRSAPRSRPSRFATWPRTSRRSCRTRSAVNRSTTPTLGAVTVAAFGPRVRPGPRDALVAPPTTRGRRTAATGTTNATLR